MATAERIAKNESLFREVNERIRELNEAFDGSGPGKLADFVCECSREGCRDYVQLTLAEYAHVRGASARFLVAPGHLWTPEAESDVERAERFWIVEKTGAVGALAAEQDPRGP